MSEIDVVIIGGGPGGYVAAIKAAHLGLKAVSCHNEAERPDNPEIVLRCRTADESQSGKGSIRGRADS
jgi:dihydrolipoamide dehydrogenase